jgi:CheY-like chemotaxis protein
VRQRALDAGAEAFLPKPVDPERLLRLLTGHVPVALAMEPTAQLAESVQVQEELGSDRYAS